MSRCSGPVQDRDDSRGVDKDVVVRFEQKCKTAISSGPLETHLNLKSLVPVVFIIISSNHVPVKCLLAQKQLRMIFGSGLPEKENSFPACFYGAISSPCLTDCSPSFVVSRSRGDENE